MRDAWDYIVVGAGTAGCVLAARLSEDPTVNVLLVEAGGRRWSPWLHVPIGYFKTVGNPRTDWMLTTEPVAELNGRRIPWPRGKVIGGSGSINGLVYVRGQPQDFDGWANQGCDGWGWSELLPYFIRSEHQERGASDFHGTGGPLAVSDTRAQFDVCNRFVEAARTHGLPANDDCNDGNQEGVGEYQTMTRYGVRASTASGHLADARRRTNLQVLTDTVCERVKIENGLAHSVELRHRGDRITVTCNREVIVSAGAVGSPQLLMLSGVGPAEHLRAFDIPVVAAIDGVGKNLQDHLKIHNSYRTSIATLNDRLNSAAGRLAMGLQYLLMRRGPLTMGAAPVFCFAHTTPQAERPDIQFHVLPWSSSDPSSGKMHEFSGFTASVCPLRPNSRGEIRLRSPKVSDQPAIDANYLSSAVDQQIAIAAVRKSRAICAESPLRDVIVNEIAPGRDAHRDEEILQFIREQASTVFHPVGTCRMGSDDHAVVDAQLRVRGVAGLRVADASIMPTITSGNTNAAVVAIAEKAADLIRQATPHR